jgi:uncharacterized coiled-coil protein SlyX
MPNEHSFTPNPGSDPASRLDRVEESLGYTERTVEQLSAEIADLNKRLQALTKRLASLEAGLSKLQGSEDEGDSESTEF